MSIAIVVAGNLHHSRQKVEGNTSKGLLAQKSAVAPILKDPEVQWLKERSLFVSAGCPSLAVSPLTEHERLLAQSLAPRAQELSNVESMVSTSSHLVPESVEQLELGTPEVRSQWYRAQSSFAPDLGRFPVSLPGVAGSPSVLVENSLSVSQLLGQPVMSSLFHVPQLGKKPIPSVSKSSQQIVDNPAPKVVRKKRVVTHEVSSSSFSTHSAVPVLDPAPDPSSVHMPMRFCSHFVRKGWCAYGDECSFAHSSDELHPLAAQQEYDMAKCWEFSG